ncbi:hypothetical protein THAOC_23442 [Thalassiosira oceanica]|uniref:Uncharacterized protein n=1 Tax=Thalassiosira oceanica TaxID=159749 RepID=K0RW48_THAOC|nr:hypothetical protein THAOC_23442 [Thalassiosira oceanica]|eukprot:EJK56634.1 hypothetical protein THAOC_23442 [Thalassiosira oceanica]
MSLLLPLTPLPPTPLLVVALLPLLPLPPLRLAACWAELGRAGPPPPQDPISRAEARDGLASGQMQGLFNGGIWVAMSPRNSSVRHDMSDAEGHHPGVPRVVHQETIIERESGSQIPPPLNGADVSSKVEALVEENTEGPDFDPISTT